MAAGKLFEPWAILILIGWLPISAILCVAAERTANPKYFLIVATIIVVGLLLVAFLQNFLMFGCLWAFTRVFGARKKSRELAISYAVASRGPALVISTLLLLFTFVAMLKGPTEDAGISNWEDLVGLACLLAIAVWYGLLLYKAIKAVYDILRFGLIFTVVVGGFIVPAVIPTKWMYAPISSSYSMGSQSMRPALEGRDHIVTNNAAYGIRSSLLGKYLIRLEPPRRGDLIVFESPDSGEDYLKRVIAVSGDTIGIVNNQPVINDKPVPVRRTGEYRYDEIDENGRFCGRVRSTLWVEKLEGAEYSILQKYCDSKHQCYGLGKPNCNLDQNTCLMAEFGPYKVPEDHVFVMGDNRNNSRDSRFFGPVHIDKVKGQVFLRFLPFGRSGVIRSGRGP